MDALAEKEFWVVAELGPDGRPADAAFELLSKAASLAKGRSAKLCVVAYGPGSSKLAGSFKGWGVSKLYAIDRPELASFQEETLANVVAAASKRYAPETILGPATIRGRSLLPRIAALLGAGLTADCTGLEIDDATGRLLQTRPAFGGNLLATIVSEAFPQMSTVRPHVFKKAKPDADGAQAVETVLLSEGWTDPVKKSRGVQRLDAGGANLANADTVVAVGMGIGGPKGVELARQLAKKLGAALAASRAVVDSGWLDYSHQVGQTGITVHPKLYIACGISGAIQHLVGMQGAEQVIAINKDADAPILSVSDIAVTGDLSEVLPVMISRL